ncbi:MAG TPA: CoA-binding protein [Vicinamibacteria bacterium]|nr:CoA-binding protein [Vicinamibacteria bacterium]
MTEPFRNPDDDALRRLLQSVRRIAIVGLSPKPHRDSNRVARYLMERGYEVVPVYPLEERILGQTVYRSVPDIPRGVDLVDVFRRSETLPSVVDEVLAAGSPALWMQLDCIDEEGARRATKAGVTVVMDRCIMVDHARLLGRDWTHPGAEAVTGGDAGE